MMANTETAVQLHDWTLMTMQSVEVIGEAPDDGEPFGVTKGIRREGINCGNCGVEYSQDAPPYCEE